jgi:NADP-dependent 3-hydroxy acid dehydrogenase YdfG
MLTNIAGKVVVIAEATSATGEAIARHLSAEGARLVLGGRDIAGLNELSTELVWDGGNVLAVEADMTDSPQAARLVAAANEAFGRVDALVNNLVSRPDVPFGDDEARNVNLTAGVQILGIVHGVVAAIPYLRRHGGHIVNVVPLGPIESSSDRAAAAETRQVVAEASEGLCDQVARDGVRTTLVAPGLTRDSMWGNFVSGRRRLQQRAAVEAASVARAVAFVIGQPDDLEINAIHFKQRGYLHATVNLE